MAWSKAFEKLLEVIDNQLGRYSNSSLMLKNAQAEADAKRLLAQADRDAEDIRQGNLTVLDSSKLQMTEVIKLGSDVKPELLTNEQRVIARLAHQEAKRDNNIQKVVAFAAQEILEKPSDEIKSVDEDLIARIFEEIKFVNKEDLQKIWAGVLAKSILRPEEISLDLIDFLRRITNKRAEEIASIGAYVFNNQFIVNCKKFENQDLELWLKLDSLGIISGITSFEGLIKTMPSAQKEKNSNGIFYGEKVIFWESEKLEETFKIKCLCVLTELGQDVIRLGKYIPDYEYFDQSVQKIKSDNPEFKIFVADLISQNEDGSIKYKNEKAI